MFVPRHRGMSASAPSRIFRPIALSTLESCRASQITSSGDPSASHPSIPCPPERDSASSPTTCVPLAASSLSLPSAMAAIRIPERLKMWHSSLQTRPAIDSSVVAPLVIELIS